MTTIALETPRFIEAALAGDPALASLSVIGFSPATLVATIKLGLPLNAIRGCSYAPHPPFTREALVALVVQTQRIRWERTAPFVRTAMPPQERDLQALHKKYDKAHIGLECGTGWTDLLDATFVLLNDIAADRDWTPSQIKEKFGCLRLYWYGDLPERGDEVISAAEHLSRHLCDVCGGGSVLGSQHGWWSTRCKEHPR